MPLRRTYEISAFITINAENQDDALKRAQRIASQVSMSPDFSLAIEDSEALDVTDEDDTTA